MNRWKYLLLVCFFSCSEDRVIIPDYSPPESDRVLLIEEFTGASCSGCPAGASAVEELLNTFPDNIVAVAIHSDHLGWPAKPGDLDLRTDDSNEIEKYLGEWRAKPEAAFNRRVFSERGENHIRVRTLPAAWINFVEDELATYAVAEIDIESHFNEINRQLDIEVNITSKEILQGDFRINVMLTEDGIKTYQKDQTSVIEDFSQKHVLRKLLTEVSGETIFTSLSSDRIVQYNTSFVLPDEEEKGWWIPQNLNVVVFLTDGDTKEVLQAGTTPIVN